MALSDKQEKRVRSAFYHIAAAAYMEDAELAARLAKQDGRMPDVNKDNRVHAPTYVALTVGEWVAQAIRNGDIVVSFPKDSIFGPDGDVTYGCLDRVGRVNDYEHHAVYGPNGSARAQAREAEALLAQIQGV